MATRVLATMEVTTAVAVVFAGKGLTKKREKKKEE